jgi:hypothetical protein
MQDLYMEQGRIKINIKVVEIGEDLCVIISGGDRAHIGCVTLSVPRPSLSDPSITSSTTSVLNLIGHKDDEAARYVSHTLSSGLNKNVVVTCGIHVDNITQEEIQTTKGMLKKSTDKLIAGLKTTA